MILGGFSVFAVAKLMAIAALKGAPLIVLAILINRIVLRRASATQRHAIWFAALAMQLLVPVFVLVGPRVPVKLDSLRHTSRPPAAAPSSQAVASTTPIHQTSGVSRTAILDLQRGDDRGAPVQSTSWKIFSFSLLAGLVWLLGGVLLLSRFCLGTLHLARVARRAEPVSEGSWLELAQHLARVSGLRRPLTLLKHDRFVVPVTWGFIYPIVLLPNDANGWSDERRRMVLLHEIAHVRRLDAIVQAVVQIGLAVFWFNPLIWIAARAIRIEREHACDDDVLSNGVQPSVYANTLVGILRSYTEPRYPAIAALAMASKRDFKERVYAILRENSNRTSVSGRYSATAAGLAIALAVPIAGLTTSGGNRISFERAEPSTSTMLWSGSIAPGSLLTVRSYGGPIIAEQSHSSLGEVSAELASGSSTHDTGALPVSVNVDGNNLVICAMASAEDSCTSEGYTPHRQPDGRRSPITLRIRIPSGVRFVSGTGQGDMSISAPEGVEAQTGNGFISVTAANGSVSAATGNGAIDAVLLGHPDTANMEFRTGNGNVSIALPPSFDADISARLSGGSVINEYSHSLQIMSSSDGKTHELRLGKGGLKVSVISSLGDLRIEQAAPAWK